MGQREHQKELDYMNAIGCVLVILIHVLSWGIANVDPTAVRAAVIYFPWRLSSFVVPMFLFTGGLKLAQQFRTKSVTGGVYLRYMKGRIRKIYLPYLLWFCIYYAALFQIHYVRGNWREALRYLLIGNLSSPFYYIVIVMQFYALMPVWVWLLRKVQPHIAICGAVLITLLMQNLGSILSLRDASFAYADRLFPTYILYWVVGMYIGKDYERLRLHLRGSRLEIFCAAAVVLFGAFAAYIQWSRKIYALPLDQIKTVADMMSIFLLLMICIRLAEHDGVLQRLLQSIHRVSFMAYLSHCLYLTLIADVLAKEGMQRILVVLPVRAAVTYGATFAVCAVWTLLRQKWHSKGGKATSR